MMVNSVVSKQGLACRSFVSADRTKRVSVKVGEVLCNVDG